jgi:spore photoproduct lyase
MWNKVYVEKDLLGESHVQAMLSKLNHEPIEIDSFDEIWGRSKKPYLHKRDSLNLFIARKKGQLLKEAPDAYGKAGEPHYYFIHAFNCIYECQYCYLQGYFNTPDIVLFVNHAEIMAEMERILSLHPEKRVWFHAGEFSDSLALSHITGEVGIYHAFCEKHPHAVIELRTKSVNIRELKELKPLPNFIVSFSLSPKEMARKIDLKTPSTKARLEAMKTLMDLGHAIGAHFDPIVYEEKFSEHYAELLQHMEEHGLTSKLAYLSLGVVRFTKDVYREVERNYPESVIHTTSMVKSFDGKVRYSVPVRGMILTEVKNLAIKYGVKKERIYFCME